MHQQGCRNGRSTRIFAQLNGAKCSCTTNIEKKGASHAVAKRWYTCWCLSLVRGRFPTEYAAVQQKLKAPFLSLQTVPWRSVGREIGAPEQLKRAAFVQLAQAGSIPCGDTPHVTMLQTRAATAVSTAQSGNSDQSEFWEFRWILT